MPSDGEWSTADVPDQSGRIAVAVVTGSNTGIGYHTAAMLAHRGAHVVLAVRNLEKGNLALARIVAAHPKADVTLQELDLSSLDSVRAAADPEVEGGQYYGPDGLGQQRGHPKLVSSSAQSHDEDLQRRLWQASEELTGVSYPV